MKFTVFIPTYNEENNITELVDKLNLLNNIVNIIIVDDNSDDNTINEIKFLKKKYKNIYFYIRSENKGRGYAGIFAYKKYIELNDESYALIEMDSDLSHIPEYIPEMLKEFNEHTDVVTGSRYLELGKDNDRNILRKILSQISRKIINLILNLNMSDPASGYRCIKKEILNKINFDKLISTGPEIVEEMYYVFKLNNLNIKEIPINFPDRKTGESKLNLIKLIQVFYKIIRIRFNKNIYFLKKT